MRFSEALEECMRGKKIARKDWNGKGMYVWFVPPHTVAVKDWRYNETVPAAQEPTPVEIERGYVDIAGHFDMMNAQGIRIIGWLASQTDMASDQWEVVG